MVTMFSSLILHSGLVDILQYVTSLRRERCNCVQSLPPEWEDPKALFRGKCTLFLFLAKHGHRSVTELTIEI
jgi:hypothetical protein